MKKYNNSPARDGSTDNSRKPARRTSPASGTAKPRRQPYRQTGEKDQQDNFTRKPRTAREKNTSNLGERPAFKRKSSATGETKPPRRKSTFADKNTSGEKPFDRRTPKGKAAPFKRTADRRETGDSPRKPYTPRPEKPFGEKRNSPEATGRRSRSANPRTGSQETSDTRSRPFKRTSTEERPQKRTEKDSYYTGKRKFSPASASKKTPDYDLKKYEEKKPRGKQEKTGKEETTRLNRYIANAGICSRREADKLIESGEIKVNGKVVTEMGYQVGTNDIVKYGNRVLNKEKLVYVLLNKPKGYITTTDDPEERKTVMDLVANACEQRIYPVGRLDRNTSGLLLFTNDGELAEKLAHPSNDIKKIYQVELDKPITKDDFQRVADGVQLEDGMATVDDVAIVTPDKTTLGIEIHIGRNRIVRRIFEHLGYEVVKLDRVSYAGLTKKDLPRGNWRFLSEKEVIKLKYFI
jgi:23S rRNA pseudouridine2605 synthase